MTQSCLLSFFFLVISFWSSTNFNPMKFPALQYFNLSPFFQPLMVILQNPRRPPRERRKQKSLNPRTSPCLMKMHPVYLMTLLVHLDNDSLFVFLFLFCDIKKSNNIHAELGVPLHLVSQQIGIGPIKV